MLLKLLLALGAFFTRPFQGPPEEQPPYEVTPYGPQSLREAHIAKKALQSEHGDMRFAAGWPDSTGINDIRFRWPGFPGKAEIPYLVHESLEEVKPLIIAAMNQYHRYTCVKFVERTYQRDYIHFVKKSGCYSYIGRVGGRQEVSLGRGCEYIGTIVHELGHAIGLFHEHQRSDRDRYINVYPQNVIDGQIHNFDKTPANKEFPFGRYDFASIMHYGNHAFAKKSDLLTMDAKDHTPLREPYEKPGLNENDIYMVRQLYRC